MLESLVPLAIKDLSIGPSVDPLSMRLASLKLSEVRITIRVPFKALTVPEVLFPVALILPSISVLHDPLSMPKPIAHLADIEGVLK
jgi:hypothetical protein